MSGDDPGRRPRPARGPQDAGAEEYLRPGRETWRSANAHVLAGLWRSVEVMETVARVEMNVARTLEALSVRDRSSAGRRLKLTGEAITAANTAIGRSKHLQREARRWAAHGGDVTTVRQLLGRSAGVLEGLAAAEKEIADILISAADQEGPELAGQRRKMAHEASAGARRATAQARLLRGLAEDAARSPPAGGGPLTPS